MHFSLSWVPLKTIKLHFPVMYCSGIIIFTYETEKNSCIIMTTWIIVWFNLWTKWNVRRLFNVLATSSGLSFHFHVYFLTLCRLLILIYSVHSHIIYLCRCFITKNPSIFLFKSLSRAWNNSFLLMCGIIEWCCKIYKQAAAETAAMSIG